VLIILYVYINPKVIMYFWFLQYSWKISYFKHAPFRSIFCSLGEAELSSNVFPVTCYINSMLLLLSEGISPTVLPLVKMRSPILQ